MLSQESVLGSASLKVSIQGKEEIFPMHWLLDIDCKGGTCGQGKIKGIQHGSDAITHTPAYRTTHKIFFDGWSHFGVAPSIGVESTQRGVSDCPCDLIGGTQDSQKKREIWNDGIGVDKRSDTC